MIALNDSILTSTTKKEENDMSDDHVTPFVLVYAYTTTISIVL